MRSTRLKVGTNYGQVNLTIQKAYINASKGTMRKKNVSKLN